MKNHYFKFDINAVAENWCDDLTATDLGYTCLKSGWNSLNILHCESVDFTDCSLKPTNTVYRVGWLYNRRYGNLRITL